MKIIFNMGGVLFKKYFNKILCLFSIMNCFIFSRLSFAKEENYFPPIDNPPYELEKILLNLVMKFLTYFIIFNVIIFISSKFIKWKYYKKFGIFCQKLIPGSIVLCIFCLILKIYLT